MMKTIDTRDLNKILEDLEYQLEKGETLSSDEITELAVLRRMENEIPEWRDGTTLIPENDWVDYVEELVKDCEGLPKNFPDYVVINWNETARNISADYAEIEYQGVNYYYRNC